MSRILITGSADGLGLMAAQLLISQGHEVMLHARNQARVADARAAAPGAAGVLAGDLSSIDQIRSVARAGQRLRPVRRGHPQRRRRLPRASQDNDRRRAQPRVRDQRRWPRTC